MGGGHAQVHEGADGGQPEEARDGGGARCAAERLQAEAYSAHPQQRGQQHQRRRLGGSVARVEQLRVRTAKAMRQRACPRAGRRLMSTLRGDR